MSHSSHYSRTTRSQICWTWRQIRARTQRRQQAPKRHDERDVAKAATRLLMQWYRPPLVSAACEASGRHSWASAGPPPPIFSQTAISAWPALNIELPLFANCLADTSSISSASTNSSSRTAHYARHARTACCREGTVPRSQMEWCAENEH